MDFIDQLRQFSQRVSKLKEQVPTEEATKMSLIVPFFQILGYDVFNPDEFMLEFTADVGIKKGEKVDYAILKDGNPVILVEAKWCGEKLDNHASQLFRYFGTTPAKFGILTNGINYKFFTDLDEPNKMDLTPFLEIDLLDLKDNLVPEIKKFHKASFDLDKVFSTASELKYTKMIKDYMAEQLRNPSDEFVRLFLSEIYDGAKKQSVVDKFRPIVKKATNDYISELMSEKITTALKKQADGDVEQDAPPEEPEEDADAPIEPTEREMEALFIIRALIGENIPNSDITFKANERYFSILYQNNSRKWLCRLMLGKKKEYIILPNEDKSSNRVLLERGIDDLYAHKDALLEVLERYLDLATV